MEKYSGIKTVNASLVLDYEYIQMLRDADRKIPNPNKIIAQGGGQENMLSTPADITICGGCRGGSKTFTLLMETLKDIKNKNVFSERVFQYSLVALMIILLYAAMLLPIYSNMGSGI